MVGQSNVTIRLSRETAGTPWGFRLQGGQEAKCPLTIQRVFVGGLSDGKLQRGDAVIAIEGQDATDMYHSRAEEIIRRAGLQLSLTVRRDGSAVNGPKSPQQQWSPVQAPTLTRSFSGGANDYYQPPRPFSGYTEPEESLRSQRGAGDEDEDYTKSVRDIKKIFSNPPANQYSGVRFNAAPGSTSYVAKRPVFAKKPAIGGQAPELGWVPKNKPYPLTQSRFGPSGLRSPPVNRRSGSEHDLSYHQTPAPTQNVHYEPPAWLGTLRSSGGPKRWEINEQQGLIKGASQKPQQPRQDRAAVHSQPYPGGDCQGAPVVAHNPRVQTLRYGPGNDGPTYGQHAPDKFNNSDTARVAHLQYNSPIGLYSKDNALEVLRSQTVGKPGQGTLQITGSGDKFDPTRHSEVYRMVQEEQDGGGRHDAGISDF